MPYDCTTLHDESESVGRCLRDDSGALESRACCVYHVALVQGEVPVCVFNQYDKRECVSKF